MIHECHFELAFFLEVLLDNIVSRLSTQESVGFRITCRVRERQYILLFVFVV